MCNFFRQTTYLKGERQYPPHDHLMQQLINIINLQNPQCANCDKRDKSNMFFCTTCGQALCKQCKEHTHLAKMFSSHEIVHMSKCNKELQKRCPDHGEQYIMFSQKNCRLMCDTCLQETPLDIQLDCLDIDAAWHQSAKKVEKSVNYMQELKKKIHDDMAHINTQLNLLKNELNMEEKSLNNYCQNLKAVIDKTQSSILYQLHCEFESKENLLHEQLLTISNKLPLLQMHLNLGGIFTDITSKHQFLELVYILLERLNLISHQCFSLKQPLSTFQLESNFYNDFSKVLQEFIETPTKIFPQTILNKKQLFNEQESHLGQEDKLLSFQSIREPFETNQFNKHCKIFDNDLQELNKYCKIVKENLEELYKDILILQKSNSFSLETQYENVFKDCQLLEDKLNQQQSELENLKTVFDALWEKQLCRIHVEKEIFHSQINDMKSLKSGLRQLQSMVQQIKPFVKKFSLNVSAEKLGIVELDICYQKQLQELVDHLASLNMQPHQSDFCKDYCTQQSMINIGSTFPKDKECPYQKISEASSLSEMKTFVKAQIHSIPENSFLKANNSKKLMVCAGDSEDIFSWNKKINAKEISNNIHTKRLRASCESLSTTCSGSLLSSFCDAQDNKKSMIFDIDTSTFSSPLPKKQSWETFPRQKNKRRIISSDISYETSSILGQLKKADSFEGHEEAVRTLVAAVQETKYQQKTLGNQKRNQRKNKTN